MCPDPMSPQLDAPCLQRMLAVCKAQKRLLGSLVQEMPSLHGCSSTSYAIHAERTWCSTALIPSS